MMNRTEELRQDVLQILEADVADFEDGGNPELDGDFVTVDYITAKRIIELLKRLEVPIEAKWHYYQNEEGRSRWKCTNCGKMLRRLPTDKRRCSHCGAHMKGES